MFQRFIPLAALAALICPAHAAEWLTDWDEAGRLAAEQGKAVLADFTGSDWCGGCIVLRRDVLDKPEFEAYAEGKFVLLEVDLPHLPKITPEQKKHNEALCAKYKVQAFPTLLVLEPDGRVLGGSVGGTSNVKKVTNELDGALANRERLAAAEALDGMARIRALYAIYNSLPKEVRAGSGLVERIVELDTQGVTPLSAQVRAKQQMDEYHKRMKEVKTDLAAQLKLVNETLAVAMPANRRQLLESRYQLLMWTADSEEDIVAAKETMLELIGTEGADASKRRAEVEKHFADPADVLRQLKEASYKKAQQQPKGK